MVNDSTHCHFVNDKLPYYMIKKNMKKNLKLLPSTGNPEALCIGTEKQNPPENLLEFIYIAMYTQNVYTEQIGGIIYKK